MTQTLPVNAHMLTNAAFSLCPVCARTPRALLELVCGGCRSDAINGGLQGVFG